MIDFHIIEKNFQSQKSIDPNTIVLQLLGKLGRINNITLNDELGEIMLRIEYGSVDFNRHFGVTNELMNYGIYIYDFAWYNIGLVRVRFKQITQGQINKIQQDYSLQEKTIRNLETI
jgi:hypothetical protein